MARLVRLEATGPIEVPPGDKSAWICACGLSQNTPHCDGSHKKTKSEEAGKCHVYNNERTEAVEVRDDA